MNLFVLDFWGYLTLAFFASVLLVGYRLTWALARFSENFIISLVRTGMHGMAKTLLWTLIGYDHYIYRQSRFIIWNQIQTRFAILWGRTLLITALSLLLQSWYVAIVLLSLIAITVWLIRQVRAKDVPIRYSDQALTSLMHDVNERNRPVNRYVGPSIRQWDYLDELFAQGAY